MTIMKLSTLIPALQNALATHGDAEVLVCVQSQGELRGHTPAVAVTDAHAGFDWDSGRVLLSTKNPLIALSADEVAAILKSVRAGQSWHAYQAHKSLRERIRELEAQLTSRPGEPQAGTSS